jgi:hypothetical protein
MIFVFRTQVFKWAALKGISLPFHDAQHPGLSFTANMVNGDTCRSWTNFPLLRAPFYCTLLRRGKPRGKAP